MSFKSAQENFETALHFADTAGDTATVHLATGMIEMVKAMQSLERIVKSMESDITSLR